MKKRGRSLKDVPRLAGENTEAASKSKQNLFSSEERDGSDIEKYPENTLNYNKNYSISFH